MNIVQLGVGEKDPKTMLLHCLERADNYENLVICARTKDDKLEAWSTSKYSWFLFACAAIIQDLAMKALNGKIVDE
jgi:hypothetical protein